MAKHKTNKHRSRAGHHTSRKHSHRRKNKNPGGGSGKVISGYGSTVMNRRRRHNTGGMSGGAVSDLAVEAVSAVGGLVGSKMLTQAVLGANNVGMFGYFGNAAATAILAIAAHYVAPRNKKIRDGVVLGGAMGIVARAIMDYTPFGGYLANAGVGEYGMAAYMPSNGVVASRYVDPWNSAMTQIPAGWGGSQIPINSGGAVEAGMAGWGEALYGGERGGLY